MVRWTLGRTSRGRLGIFFVRKKDGKIRIILDTRLTNLLFLDPPSTRLATAGALSRLEFLDDGELFVASGDVQRAFYHLEVPEELSDFFWTP